LLRFARNDGTTVIARSVSDEAIQVDIAVLDCFASLAMTGLAPGTRMRKNPCRLTPPLPGADHALRPRPVHRGLSRRAFA
jgi:hypothetical protein